MTMTTIHRPLPPPPRRRTHRSSRSRSPFTFRRPPMPTGDHRTPHGLRHRQPGRRRDLYRTCLRKSAGAKALSCFCFGPAAFLSSNASSALASGSLPRGTPEDESAVGKTRPPSGKSTPSNCVADWRVRSRRGCSGISLRNVDTATLLPLLPGHAAPCSWHPGFLVRFRTSHPVR